MFNFLMRFTNSGKISAATTEEQMACLEAVILTLCNDRLLTFMEQWEFQQLHQKDSLAVQRSKQKYHIFGKRHRLHFRIQKNGLLI